LAEIKPKFIVCLGNGKGKQQSAFGFVRGTAAVRPDSYHEEFAGDSRYRKKFVGTFALGDGEALEATVVGVRHPSYPTSPRALRGFIGC